MSQAKLMPKYLKQRFAFHGSQDWRAERLPNNMDPCENFPGGVIIVAKYFHPWSSWTWYASEWDEENQTWFGFVDGMYGEWGYFSMAEFESLSERPKHSRFGLPMERDTSFKECRFRDIRKDLIGEGIYCGR